MDIKRFFKNKINLTFVILLGVSILLLVIANFVVQLMGASVMLFGVTCGFAIPVVLWFKRATDNSKAFENIELTQRQSKQVENQQKSNKMMYIVLIAMLAIFAGVLVYSGAMMYMTKVA